MQSSTLTYVENVQHDLRSARGLKPEMMGCLDPSWAPEIRACYLESAEKLMRSLRVALETFDKIVDSLRVLELPTTENDHDLYTHTLAGWIRDMHRMLAAETAHKKMILSLLGSDSETIDLQVQRWIQQPMINQALWKVIEEA